MVGGVFFLLQFLVSSLVDFMFKFLPGTLEFAHAFTEAPGKFGKFF